MTLYTKTGDNGQTQFPDGTMRSKSDPRVVAIGELDELNANLGLCLRGATAAWELSDQEPSDQAKALPDIAQCLSPLQAELFVLGAALAQSPRARLAVTEKSVARLEHQIDALCATLPPLAHFVLPAGCELACRLHVARTVCRRAERAMVALRESCPDWPVEPLELVYLNRMSDLLFALARAANFAAGETEIPWQE